MKAFIINRLQITQARYYFIYIFLCIFIPGVSPAFNIPEKLVYDLTWTGVKAGTASLEVINDKDSFHIISTANSAQWVSIFYTVDDRVEAVLSKGDSEIFIGKPLIFRMKLREGKHRRDKEVIFDHINHRATYIDNIKREKKEYPVNDKAFDPLSVLYYVRAQKLEVGKSLYVEIFDNNKLWNVEIQVLRKERISTIFGDLDTIVIKPLMKSEGIFNRKGELHIWLTDDQRHIPVKMQTKVAVGAITATLTKSHH